LSELFKPGFPSCPEPVKGAGFPLKPPVCPKFTEFCWFACIGGGPTGFSLGSPAILSKPSKTCPLKFGISSTIPLWINKKI